MEKAFFLLVQQHTQQLGDVLQERLSLESEVEVRVKVISTETTE